MHGFVRWASSPSIALLAAGCIITSADDDGGSSGSSGAETSQTGMPSSGSPSSGLPSTSGSTSTTGGTATDGTTGDTDGLPDNCGDNLLVDPGFESGTPNPSWAESSDIFGTPICDLSCTEDSGAAPHGGQWWVWFGGIEDPDSASVSQAVAIAPDVAYLTFFFEINAAQGEIGDDLIVAEIDGNAVFMATDAEIDDYGAYTEVLVDISEYADGAAHTLTFRAELTGAGLTNFFVDDVGLVSCSGGGSSGSTGTGTDSMTTGTGTSTGTDTDTDTTGTTGTSTTQ